jgi:hypothetical protein
VVQRDSKGNSIQQFTNLALPQTAWRASYNTEARTGGMGKAAQHLPGKHKELSSNPSTAKEKI